MWNYASKHSNGGTWRLLTHAALLVVALCTYLKDPDDVVWRFIKLAPNVRVLEHLCFGLAAAALGFSIWLRASVDIEIHESDGARSSSGSRQIFSGFLQAVGIGSLMPLAGFILLVFGETAFAVLRDKVAKPTASECPETHRAPRDLAPAWSSRLRESLAKHIGPWLAFLSMIIFSITLSDRLADFLFAGAALATAVAFFLRLRSSSRRQSS